MTTSAAGVRRQHLRPSLRAKRSNLASLATAGVKGDCFVALRAPRKKVETALCPYLVDHTFIPSGSAPEPGTELAMTASGVIRRSGAARPASCTVKITEIRDVDCAFREACGDFKRATKRFDVTT